MTKWNILDVSPKASDVAIWVTLLTLNGVEVFTLTVPRSLHENELYNERIHVVAPSRDGHLRRPAPANNQQPCLNYPLSKRLR